MVLRAVILAVALVLLGSTAPARAAEPLPSRALDASERDALMAGYIVSRPVRFQHSPTQIYVGGVSYQVINASPAEVRAALLDLEALPQVLPRTKRAALVENSGGRAR